ncbi:MAG: XRE family transcriptional regulator [Gordonibacter sp.]|uniref:LexA family protein n=1 Tax=Gordonibacter sp. TaxID=1968902 RepID=UPI002FC58D8B
MSAFSDNINKLRSIKELNQRELAGFLGVSKSTVGNWEAGHSTPDLECLERIADFFGVRVGALFMEDLDVDILAPWTNALVLGSIAAGTPIEMMEATTVFPAPTEVLRNHPQAFFLEVEGESMNRKLPNGCYALIDPSRKDTVLDNHAYALCVNGYDATIKRVCRLNNGFKLVPDSIDPTYKPIIYDYGVEGTEEITVIGEVVWYTVPFDFAI